MFIKGTSSPQDQVDFLHVGRFKSGPEPLTHEGPSPEAREALQVCLGSIRDSWLELATDPGARAALEAGPWSPLEAKARGLVNEVGYESDALAEAKKLAKAEAREVVFGPRSGANKGGLDICEIVRVIAGGGDGVGDKPHIAVVPAQGAITTDSGGPLASGGIPPAAMVKTLRKLAKNDAVKAVVIRIDSPGGSPLASDLIWHELMELRKKKPVIASVGGMAASGGYYIAAGAQRIIAEPGSIVGSIGVFGGKLVLGPALSEVGVNSFTFPANPAPGSGERAAYLSPLTPWDEPTRERGGRGGRNFDLFISLGEGRKMPADKGWRLPRPVWSATQGLERGLVDEIGGFLTPARPLASWPSWTRSRRNVGAAPMVFSICWAARKGADSASIGRVARLSRAGAWPRNAARRARPFAATLAKCSPARAWWPRSLRAHGALAPRSAARAARLGALFR